jgi:hypothetical protein
MLSGHHSMLIFTERKNSKRTEKRGASSCWPNRRYNKHTVAFLEQIKKIILFIIDKSSINTFSAFFQKPIP